jgi:catechol 2,3-dioxygenase-like lactoylglutathione lyase family enzyme
MTAMTQPLLHVKTIDHITLVVRNLEAASRFYREVLGMRPVERPAFGFPGAWFQAGGTQIHMNVAGEEAGEPGIRVIGAKNAPRAFHFAFEVDDCDSAASALEADGHPIEVIPRSRPDGARQMYLRDPDGHLVELYSRAGQIVPEPS